VDIKEVTSVVLFPAPLIVHRIIDLVLAFEVLVILRNIWDPIIGQSALKYKRNHYVCHCINLKFHLG